MKTKSMTKKLLGGVMSLLFLFAVAGCSDGVHPGTPSEEKSASVSATPPIVDYFGVNSEDGKEVTINSGESVTLMWSVQNVGRVEIASTGSNTKFSYTTETELAGKAVVDAGVITETTTFVLTAYPKEAGTAGGTAGGAPAPAAGSVVKDAASANLPGTPPAPSETVEPVTAQVQVIVRPATAIDIQFNVNDPSLVASTDGSYSVPVGNAVVVHWAVTPAEAAVTLSSTPALQPILVDCASGEELEATENYPAEGCAKVYPTENTTVTLTATMGDLAPATKEIQLAVSKSPNIESFSITGPDGSNAVNGGKIRVASYPAKVTLAWKVSPMNAKVTINAESAEVEGSREVEVNDDTTFTLTAVANGEEKTGTVGVEVDMTAFNCEQISVASSIAGPAFIGEMLNIRWTLSGAASSLVKTVDVRGSATEVYSKDVKEGSINLAVKSPAYVVTFKDAGGTERCPKMVNTSLAQFEGLNAGKAIRAVADKDKSGVYVGMDLEGYNGGSIQAIHYSDSVEVMNINFKKVLGGPLTDRFLDKVVKTFPVNAIAVNADSGQLFVATTGLVMQKAPDGDWTALDPFIVTDPKKNYPGKHPSCFGKVQEGLKKSNEKIVTMNQICDMATGVDGKLYVAHDFGIYVYDSVEGKANSKPTSGRDKSNALFLSVVNDVEVLADGSAIAGGAKGVYKSVDGGASWTSLNGGELSEGTYVNSVEVGASTMGADGTITSDLIAGTDKGVFAMKEGAWKKAAGVDGKAYSVAVDPSNPLVIYAGAETGFYVSRDGGATFAPVVAGVVVRSIAISQSEGKQSIYLATESGVKRATISLGTGEVVSDEPQNPETPPAETGTPPTGTTPTVGA